MQKPRPLDFVLSCLAYTAVLDSPKAAALTRTSPVLYSIVACQALGQGIPNLQEGARNLASKPTRCTDPAVCTAGVLAGQDHALRSRLALLPRCTPPLGPLTTLARPCTASAFLPGRLFSSFLSSGQ